MLKLLHISDIHLGAKFGFLGENAEVHRERIIQSLASTVDEAIKAEVDAVLITGDIFDNYYPSKQLVSKFTQELDKLAAKSIFTVILPGNHDRLESGSVWSDYQNGKFIKVFNHEGVNTFHIEELNLHLVGNPIYTQKSKQSPLGGLREVVAEVKGKDNKSYVVAMAHGSVSLAKEADNYPIAKEEIAGLGADYLALGDWHGMLDVSQGEQVAFYAGSLECLATDQINSGHALFVQIENGKKTVVTPRKLSGITVRTEEINLNQIDVSKLEGEISKFSDGNLMLSVKLTGERKIQSQENIDIGELIERLSGQFYYLNIIDTSKAEIDFDGKNQYPEGSIPFEFLKLLEQNSSSGKISAELAKDVFKLGMKTIHAEKAGS